MVGIADILRRSTAVLILLIAGTASAQGVLDLYGEENAGTAGAQFLRIPAGARAVGLAQAAVAGADDASGAYWNPASVIRTERDHNLFAGHTEYAADIGIEHSAYQWRRQNFGFAVTAAMLRSGDIPRTTEFYQEGTGDFFSADMYVLGLTVARAMTDRFSIGMTAKYYQENLDEFVVRSALLDLGILYYVGVGDLRVGFAVRNFGPDLTPGGTPPDLGEGFNTPGSFQGFSAPTSGSFGTAYTWTLSERIRLMTAADFHHPTDYSETFRFGGELDIDRLLFLRAGRETNRVEGGLSAGFGVGLDRGGWDVRMDYAMRDMGAFGTVHMVSVDLAPPARRTR